LKARPIDNVKGTDTLPQVRKLLVLGNGQEIRGVSYRPDSGPSMTATKAAVIAQTVFASQPDSYRASGRGARRTVDI
jgi:hypothetical protein